MAKNGTLQNSYRGYTYRMYWSATQSIANNASTVLIDHWLDCGSGWDLYVQGRPINCSVGSDAKSINSAAVSTGGGNSIKLGTTSHTVRHNDDGSLTVNIKSSYGMQATIAGTWVGSIDVSGSITLDDIPRAATITDWPDSWNDEENPTIKYSNPAGNAVTSLQACISFDGSKDDVAYRDITKTSDTYQFPLTTAERAILQKGTLSGSTSRKVKFFVKTVIGGVTYWSASDNTELTIVNCAPTLSPTAEDTNPATIALTGNPQTIVRHQSVVSVNSGAKALKYASIVNQAIVCGSTTLNAGSGTIKSPQSNLFKFVASDDRGQTATPVEKLLGLVEYVNLTCSQSVRINLDTLDETSAIAELTISGSYFDGNFGKADNTLELWYRYKEVTNPETPWSTLDQDGWRSVEETIVKSDNKYSTVIEIAGLDYSKQYVFQCRAIDAIYTGEGVTTKEYTVQTRPVFDWSGDDFNFNVPVSICGVDVTPTSNRHIYSTPGVAGSTGYIKMARLTHRKANADTPITFVFTRRLEASPMTVHVQFKSNSQTTDPDLKDITYEGSNYGAFIVRVATSVWDLYVQKGSAYDTITLHTWFSSGTVSDRLIVEFPGELEASLPTGLGNEGYYRATPLVTRSIIDCFMPVGYVLTLYSHADPNTMYPGTTWERIVNRFLWACDTDGTIGQIGGESTHKLTVNEIPAHSHGAVYSGTSGVVGEAYKYAWYLTAGDKMAYGTISTGGGAAHNNMPPYIQVSVWRRTA